jgi:hypothetical protein
VSNVDVSFFIQNYQKEGEVDWEYNAHFWIGAHSSQVCSARDLYSVYCQKGRRATHALSHIKDFIYFLDNLSVARDLVSHYDIQRQSVAPCLILSSVLFRRIPFDPFVHDIV